MHYWAIILGCTKIAVFSMFFSMLVYICAAHMYIDEQLPVLDAAPETQKNQSLYQNAYDLNFANIGVALSTRIGIQYGEVNSDIQREFYTVIPIVWTTSQERKEIRENLLSENMIAIKEYYNLSQINIPEALKTSPNRANTIESILSQLQIRYANAQKSIKNLTDQKQLILDDMNSTQNDINRTKSSMEQHFTKQDVGGVLDDTDTYLALRNTYSEDFTDIVFINQFIEQYDFLNKYNVWRIDTINTNKQALIDETYVVVPNSWDAYLKSFDLIFDENEVSTDE